MVASPPISSTRSRSPTTARWCSRGRERRSRWGRCRFRIRVSGASDEGQSIGQEDLRQVQGDPPHAASCGSSARTRATSSGRVKRRNGTYRRRRSPAQQAHGNRAHVHLRHRHGRSRARSSKAADISLDKRTDELDDERDPPHPRGHRAAELKVEGDLRREVSMNIKRLMDLGCYRGLRHRKGLPVRGQRTHTNARTRKGPRKGAGDQAQDRRRRAPKPWPDAAVDRRRNEGRRSQGTKKVKKNIQSGIAHIQRRSTTRSSRSPTCQRQRASRGRRPASRGFKGSRKSTPFAAQLAAEDAAHKAMEHGMRSVTVFVKGPGSGRESALRALAVGGLQDHADPRRHPDPAQRLPAAQAAPRLIQTSRSVRIDGSLHRSRLPALPPRRHEALPQGRALLHRQVRLRAARRTRRASTARRGAASSRTTASQLREKQKVKRIYGVARAPVPRLLPQGRSRMKGVTGEKLLQLLERRLDNVVYRLGFASDHAEARQLVRHGHFTVNGKRVNIPSFLVRAERHDRGARDSRKKVDAHPREPRRRRSPRRAEVARARQGQLHGHAQGAARRARI